MFGGEMCNGSNDEWKNGSQEEPEELISNKFEEGKEEKNIRKFYDDGNMNFVDLMNAGGINKHEIMIAIKDIADKRRQIVERDFEKKYLIEKLKDIQYKISDIDKSNEADIRLIDIEMVALNSMINLNNLNEKYNPKSS